MKQILIETLKKIFKVHNLELGEIDIREDIIDRKRQPFFSFMKRRRTLLSSPFYSLNFSLCVKNTSDRRKLGNYTIYTCSYDLHNFSISDGTDIEFIGTNCLRVIQNYRKSSYNNLSDDVILKMIDKTIELSITAIATGDRDENSSFSKNRVKCVGDLLSRLEKWSNRTYEGRKIPFSFILNCRHNVFDFNGFHKLNQFLKDDACAPITDGISSYFSIADKLSYEIAEVFNPETPVPKDNSEFPLVPYRFSSIGNECTSTKLGIILTVQGDILLIKKRRLIYAKRNGEWLAYDFEAFRQRLFRDSQNIFNLSSEERQELNVKRKNIYLTCLDVAFARTGGCLAICAEKEIDHLLENINKLDIHKPYRNSEIVCSLDKRYFLEDIIIKNKMFEDLGRKARQELLGIDGATVITTNGQFITTGAIMDNSTKEKESIDLHGGARTKIAKKLSQYGVAIKISADGYIECYQNNERVY